MDQHLVSTGLYLQLQSRINSCRIIKFPKLSTKSINKILSTITVSAMGTRYINRKTQLLTAPQCASAKSDDAPHGVQGAHRTYRQGYLFTKSRTNVVARLLKY